MKRLAVRLLALAVTMIFQFAAVAQPCVDSLVSRGLSRAREQALLMFRSISEGESEAIPEWDWTSGFFPGELWLLYEYYGDSTLAEAASVMTERLEDQQYNTSTHDVGFMVGCSFGNGFRLTGREDYREALINAANSLRSRFNPGLGLLRSWDGPGFMVIVDNMMNLELLAEASRLTGDSSYLRVAVSHADRTLENHFREDGSSWHMVDYDTLSLRPLRKVTVQGLSDGSSWARGQSWGLYGYTMMYRETGKAEYLAQARKIASFLMNHRNMPSDHVPYWDYDAPDAASALAASSAPGPAVSAPSAPGTSAPSAPGTSAPASSASALAAAPSSPAATATPRDASAAGTDPASAPASIPRDASSAAIMASALIQLSDLTGDESYRNYAITQIATLETPEYLAAPGTNSLYLLRHSTADLPKSRGIDQPVTYADYYLVEALLRLSRPTHPATPSRPSRPSRPSPPPLPRLAPPPPLPPLTSPPAPPGPGSAFSRFSPTLRLSTSATFATLAPSCFSCLPLLPAFPLLLSLIPFSSAPPAPFRLSTAPSRAISPFS